MSVITFLMGLVIGVVYHAFLQPIMLKLWKRFQGWLNRQPKDPVP